jgi:hypothetical protein
MYEDRFALYREWFEGLGMDKETIDKIQGILDKFVDKRTGKMKTKNKKRVEELMMSTLLESPQIIINILNSTKLLEKQIFRSLWLKEELEEMLPQIEEFMERLGGDDEEKRIEFLTTNKYLKEKREYGAILYRHYIKIITPEFIDKVTENLMRVVLTSKDAEEVRMAKVALNSFNFLPGNQNIIIMYLFIKSLVEYLNVREEIKTSAPSEEEAQLAIRVLEDHLYGALAEGEEFIKEEGK